MQARIDKINSFSVLGKVFLFLFLYFAVAEFALNLNVFENVVNESDYYAAVTFSEKDFNTAKKFRRELSSLGERRVVMPGTLFYRYKSAEKETFTINSLGFRGKEPKPKEEGEYRIMFFGDSVIFGMLLSDENTIPAIVERNLNNIFRNKKITVFNFGVEGFDLQRISDAAKFYYREIKPDMVVVYSGLNDINSAFGLGNQEWKPFLDGDTLPPALIENQNRDFFEKSRVLNTIKLSFINDFPRFVKSFANRDLLNESVPPEKIKVADDFVRIFSERVENICGYFEENNIRAVFVIPSLVHMKKSLTDIEKHLVFRHESFSPGLNFFSKYCCGKIVEILGKKQNLHFVDQSRVFDGISDTVFYDGVHFTPDGVKFAADKMSEELVKILKTEAFFEKEAL